MTDSPSEHTSLLRPAEVNSDYHPENTNNVSFYSALAIFFLANAGLGAAVPPTTSILQDIICASHYATQPQGVEIDCQAGPIQAKLTMVKGLASLLLLLPGVVLGIPYGTLAKHWGPKKVLVLSITGILFAELWFGLVCWYGQTWPVELVYGSFVFYLIGGGPGIGGSMLFVLVANASPLDRRASRFFLLEASGYTGSVVGYMGSSAIMDKTVWTPIILGLGSVFMAFSLTLIMPENFSSDSNLEQSQATELTSDSTDTKEESVLSWLRTSAVFLKQQPHILVTLFGYLLRSLGTSVMRLLITYVPKRFHMSFSQSAYFVSLDSTTHLAVLLILPVVNRFLINSRRPASVTTDLKFARGSILLSALGSAGMALASSPIPFAISIALYGLGGGYSQSIRAILTATTPSEHRSIIYSVMGMMETLGTLLGAPLWPLMYQFGLELAGPWVALPFLATAVLFGIVLITLLAGKFRVPIVQ
ncbi:hypothetical protein N7491_000007 [Penicillium cf. griseofulvum]|uniref:Major facilitator superfamily (MFS) profile domain-containing protein n=1 Tax=Penicillium cf. griseofulvum TaxID=2972120 RepID=A0A9W9MEF9_9EURO|nr:hypothetical protein N7472_004639 [Penicillium cf. griseofulvum]KAJ5450825.1 hypothetical protein N7491_000007 [Penicillium cf. griseofulvum]